jgi:hypothetical protein
MEKMRAIVFHGVNDIRVEEVERPRAGVGMQPLFAGRDDLITLLARSGPASADRLTDLYVSYRKIMNS